MITNHTVYNLPSDPVTGSCPYEYYSTEDLQLYNINEDDEVNTLKIRPYSDNDRSDYVNGVSTLDMYAIYLHLHYSPQFEDRSPEEDAPYRYISADADYDNDVDDDDIDMIQDLILALRDDLNRNSWEWVLNDEVQEGEERFNEYPYMYDFVIDYNWPGSDGIILPDLSTNQIEGDNDKYFGFSYN
ncbi:MAG TPA: hypothetical protein VFG10_16970 [Saprospiraceae bacterium]|nr:hypothetical protein [Saprospiraceae bacterium]